MSVFDEAAIKAHVAAALATDTDIPAGHRGALVSVIDMDKASIAIATKVNDHWEVEIVAEHKWTGDNAAGAIIKATW